MKNYLVNKKNTNEQLKYNKILNVMGIEKIENIEEIYTDFKAEWKKLSLVQRVDLLINSLGKDSRKMLPIEKIIQLVSIIPFIEHSTHISYTSPFSQGKTFQYSKIFPNSKVISSGITEAALFYNKNKGEFGILKNYDVVAFDDVQCLNNDTIASAVYDFLSSGNLSRSNNVANSISHSSIIFLSNYTEETQKKLENNPYFFKNINLFEPFSDSFQKEAFKSRVVVLPAYLMRDENFIISEEDIYGININVLHKFFQEKLKESLPLFKIELSCKERLKNNIYAIVSGLSKLLFDDLENIPEKYLQAFIQLAEKLVELPFENILKLYNKKELNYLLIELSSTFFKYPIESIVEAYIYEDRCILRFREEKNILYKIALTKYGIKKNLKEFKNWENASSNQKSYLIESEVIDKDGIILRSYTELSVFGDYKKVNLDSFYWNQDNIQTEICEIKDELKECKEALKDLANILKNLNISYRLNNVVFKNRLLLSEEEYRDLKDERKGYLGKLFDIYPQDIRNYDIIFNIKNNEIKFLNYDFVDIKKENSLEDMIEYHEKVKSLK
ncbi:BREX system Lon protease-like protein BrxL [Fusobacterium polymorphum]|uniref:BREX system Lon protease-like protein BrxL n=1 Tax=Fusobacterium nucleatum subsp. polymorphum TaxID=76857 RepID=UPI00300955EC